MKKQKKWLYEKWLEEHRQEEEKANISQKIGVEKDKVIVQKVSFWGKALEIMTDLFFKLLAGILAVTIFSLISLALTVLINPDLRNYVFDYIFAAVGV